jgi:hypothetical protein
MGMLVYGMPVCFLLKIQILSPNILILLTISQFNRKLKNFAAHLDGDHGTLVCRGSPVEKHWFILTGYDTLS